MGRNRLPKAVHERNGTFEKHPEREARYANEPKPADPALGPPPAHWLPHPRSAEAPALFAAGRDTYSVAEELGMTYEQAKALRPGAAPSEESELLCVWREIVSQAPPGILTSSDRLHVEMTCRIIRRVRTGQAKSGDFNSIREFLGKMAMNPADRPKLQVNAGGAPAPAGQPDGQGNTNPFEAIAEEVRQQSRGRPN